MFAALILAGVVLRPIALDEPVLDVRVADVDLDGHEDVVAITKTELLVFRGTAKGLARRVNVGIVMLRPPDAKTMRFRCRAWLARELAWPRMMAQRSRGPRDVAVGMTTGAAGSWGGEGSSRTPST